MVIVGLIRDKTLTGDMEIIATAKTCFNQKFGIPRQSGLTPHSTGEIIFKKEFSAPEAFRGLEGLSHIWVIFQFHQANQWSPTVRPPRLGGNVRQGVFATRSPFRPNNIGLSLVKLENIRFKDSKAILTISDHDLLTGTPIIDIKPYHPTDIRHDANSGWIDRAPLTPVDVTYEPKVNIKIGNDHNLKKLIDELLQLDPRPSFHNNDSQKKYAMLVNGYDICWEFRNEVIVVTDIINKNENKD